MPKDQMNASVALADEELFSCLNGLWTGKKLPFKEVSVIRNTNFGELGNIDLSDVALLSVESKQFESKKLYPGDIIIERSGGGPKQPVGRVVYFDISEGDYSFSNFTSCIRVLAADKLLNRFVFYYLLFFYESGMTEPLQARTTGIRNLDFNRYKRDVRVPVPHINEQKEVIHTLDVIESAIRNQDRIIQTTTELKKALMQKLFTEGLHGEKQKQTEIGPMPESWKVARLGEIAKVERGKFSHRPRNDPKFYDGDIPFIQTGDVANSNGRVTSYTQTLNTLGLSVSRMFPKGTVVISIAANIGDTAILEFDSAFPDSIIGITRHEDILNTFLELYLRTQKPRMNALAPKGTQKNINIQFLKPWLVPIPSMKEQAEITNTLQTLANKIENSIKKRATLQALFRTMLNQLMTGQIRVKELKPQAEAVTA